MKWSEQLTSKLKELCHQGKSNKEIASILGCDVADVYNKRSSLGITIEKCKGIKPNPEFEKALPKKGMHKDVKKAFDDLNTVILLTMASDWTNPEDTELYAQLSKAVIELKYLGEKAFSR